MNQSIESMLGGLGYEQAFIALLLLCFLVLIQVFLTAPLAFLKNQQAPGMPLKGDHQLLSFRVLRTHQNSVESLAPFGFVVMLAVCFGANQQWTNWLATIHVMFRVLFMLVYYSGIGKVAGGARTLSFVGGLMANIGLVIVVLWAALF